MTTATLDDRRKTSDDSPVLADRMERMEGEMSELRQTLAELADIVVGDIRDRRESAIAASQAIEESPLPAAVVPGGQVTLNAVAALRRPFLLIDFFREVGTMVRMYTHPRYRVRRSAQLTVLLLIGLIVANYFFLGVLFYIPIVSEIAERVIDVVLVVLLYKTLSREVLRYRQVIAQLAFIRRTAGPVPASLINNDPDTAALSRQESP
jgi:hypothetical protein